MFVRFGGSLGGWLVTHTDVIQAAVALLGVTGLIAGLLGYLWQRTLRVGDFPFEIIAPHKPKEILPKIFDTEDPLPAYSVPYQTGREGGEDIQGKLRELLQSQRRLIIKGKTGVGKTREGGELATSLSKEGYAVIVLTKKNQRIWLGRPEKWPPINDKRIVVFLDDLHILCDPALQPQSPLALKVPFAPLPGFQDRLREFLDDLSKRADKVLVLATARIEDKEWLKINPSHPLWDSFAKYEIQRFSDEAGGKLLSNYAGQLGVSLLDSSTNLASKSDGMAETLVGNVNRASTEGQPLDSNTFLPTIEGSYGQVYEDFLRDNPKYANAIALLYDTTFVLREVGFPLSETFVVKMAARLAGGTMVTLTLRQMFLRRALDRLLGQPRWWGKRNGLLLVRDGVLEGKETLPDPFSVDNLNRIAKIVSRKEWPNKTVLFLDVGIRLQTIGQPKKALDVLDKALQFSRDVQSQSGEAITLVNIGEVHLSLGDADHASRYFSEAYTLAKAQNDVLLQGKCLISIARLNTSVGNYSEAMYLCEEATKLFRMIGDQNGLASALSNLALIHQYVGLSSEALRYHENSFEAYHEVGDRLGELQQLNSLGALWLRLGETTRAAEYFERALDQANDLGYQLERAHALSGLGAVKSRIEDFEEAWRLFGQACDIYQSIGVKRGEIESVSNLAIILKEKGQLSEAIHILRKSLEEARLLRDPDLTSNILLKLGEVYQASGRREEAITSYQEAVSLVETLRSRLDDTYRMAFLTPERSSIYARTIQLLQEEDRPTQSFALVEQAKSRALLDQLASSRLTPPSNVEQKSLEEETRLLEKVQNLTTMASSLAVPSPSGISLQLHEAQAKLEALWDHWQSSSPEYVSLRKGEAARFESIRQIVVEAERVDRRVLIIEYFTTDDATLLFGIRADWDEPKVVQIKQPLKEIRKYVKENFGLGESDEREKHQTAVRKVSKLDLDEWQTRFASFVEPVRNWAEPGDYVYLAPHDVLHYLPLHMLKVEGSYLVERNPVIYIPSASVLRYCLAKRKGRREKILVLGDPDVEFRSNAREEAWRVAELFNTQPYVGLDARKSLVKEKLEKERDEIDILHFACPGKFHPYQALKSGILMASESDKKEKTAEFEIELDGLPISRYLTAEEFFEMEMHADLVTLSFGSSGVNQIRPGDELFGLMRALIYAGTPSVVMSLWDVNDMTTEIFMVSFYGRLRQGDTKADALRFAQCYVKNLTAGEALAFYRQRLRQLSTAGSDERERIVEDSIGTIYRRLLGAEEKEGKIVGLDYPIFNHPADWAPFILVGDWK